MKLKAAILIAVCSGLSLGKDPFLGTIKDLKCVNCVRDSILFTVIDPVNGGEFAINIPQEDYNALITPLPGKRVFQREGCFYWVKPKPRPAVERSEKGVQGKKKAAGRKAGKAAKSAKAAKAKEPEKSAATATAEPQLSRCIPFTLAET
jgi:hypothetical protein